MAYHPVEYWPIRRATPGQTTASVITPADQAVISQVLLDYLVASDGVDCLAANDGFLELGFGKDAERTRCTTRFLHPRVAEAEVDIHFATDHTRSVRPKFEIRLFMRMRWDDAEIIEPLDTTPPVSMHSRR